MPDTKKDPNNNKWIRKLQLESWELELLISGFSIFLLIKSIDWQSGIIETISFHFEKNIISMILIAFVIFIRLATYVFVANLIIHLFLRGFWVGTVGLGSVAPKTDLKKLHFSDYFNKKLERKIKSLDDLVNSIDRISSLIFSFTFLIMFYIISFGLYLIVIGLIIAIVNKLSLVGPEFLTPFYGVILIIVVATGLLYIIDFFLFGILRRNRIVSKIYYPIYWFYNTITLSFIYRTIYYNLVSRYSKGKMALILLPYLLLILVLASFSIDDYKYFPDNETEYNLNHNFYSTLREEDSFIRIADIPSPVIIGGFIPLFIRYDVNDNDSIDKICPDFKPEKKRLKNVLYFKFEGKGVNLSIKYPPSISEPHPDKNLECLSNFYDVYLNDSLYTNLKFYLYTHQNNDEKGIITMLDVSALEHGENRIRVFKKTDEEAIATIPFWLEK